MQHEERTERDEAHWVLIARYLAGDCLPDERAQMEAWLAADPSLRDDVRRLRDARAYVARTRAGAAQWNVMARWRALAPLLRAHVPAIGRTATQPPRSGRRARWPRVSAWRRAWAVPAAVLLGTVVLLFGWRYGTSFSGGHGHTASKTAVSTYVTGPGERATIMLPDGNIAALNVASRLEVPANYLTGHHTVHLSGEALFTILHRDRVPFTVLAGSTSTHVLGTDFVVRHYPADSGTLIAVRTGRVAVRNDRVTHPVVLAAAQQVTMARSGVPRVDPASAADFSFATGTLWIDAMSLREAIPELDRWYDADIRLAEPALATRRITVECAAGSLTDLAAILEMTLNLHVVRDGRILTLSSR